MNLRHYAFTLVGLLPLHTYAAVNPDQVHAIVDEVIQPMVAEFEVPGMAIAVTIDGKLQIRYSQSTLHHANSVIRRLV